ncbi:MAG: dihydrofolate reductase [Rhizobiaceae bacterium]
MSAISISIVVAIADNGVIGKYGGMPWRLSSDLKRFKEITLGKPVIMGRKTYESIGKALPGRLNIVVSRSGFSPEDALGVDGLNSAIDAAKKWAGENDVSEICIIGGGQIYMEALARTDRIYLTHVMGTPDGDTVFPDVLLDENWHSVSRENVPIGEKDSMETVFAVYERKK